MIKVFKPASSMTKSLWSGGTTTQIDLYPSDASYKERNFLYRISSAVIEESPSVFTSLPDYQRWITMLNTSVFLDHEPQVTIKLEPFEVYQFDGGRETRSMGCAQDFNLMIRNGTFAWMKIISGKTSVDLMRQAELVQFKISDWMKGRSSSTKGHLAFFYPEVALNGITEHCYVINAGEREVLNSGDYLCLEDTANILSETVVEYSPSAKIIVMYIELK